MIPLLHNIKNAVANAFAESSVFSGFVTAVVNHDNGSAMAELRQGERLKIDLLHAAETMVWIEVPDGLKDRSLAIEVVFRLILDKLPDEMRGNGMCQSAVEELGIDSATYLENELHKLRRLSSQAGITHFETEEKWFDRRFADTKIKYVTVLAKERELETV